MAIEELWHSAGIDVSGEMSKEKIQDNRQELSNYIAYWREYPDKLVDFLTPNGSNFNLYFYQRILLRIILRYPYTYATCTRAYSKSFLSILALLLKSILYPGIKLFISSGTKKQAAGIAKEKLDELLYLLPQLKNEIVGGERGINKGSDYLEINFKNRSNLMIVGVSNSSRGGRRHSGLLEEAILIDGTKLNEVILPLMNIDRRAANGLVDPNENHKSHSFITTAGYKNTFAYKKQIQFLIWQVLLGKGFVIGGDFEIPVSYGLLDENFVKELKLDGTYNEMSFSREYGSRWSGSIEGSFYNPDLFDRQRILEEPENFRDVESSLDTYYIIGIDVGRLNDSSEAVIIKVVPDINGVAKKEVVWLESYEKMHFKEQSIRIKKLYNNFLPEAIVIDANGIGAGLVDYLIDDQIESITGEILPTFAIKNDSRYEHLKKKTDIDVLFNIKANESLNSEMHINLASQMSSNKLHFLLDERAARKLVNKEGQIIENLSIRDRAKRLKPFILTTLLKDQVMNLVKKNEEMNKVSLKRYDVSLGKDKFSALEYGLYYISMKESNVTSRMSGIMDYLNFN